MLNRDALVEQVWAKRQEYSPCKDSRNRDALNRMGQAFQNLAACNQSDTVVLSSYNDVMQDMARMWEHDLRHTCEMC